MSEHLSPLALDELAVGDPNEAARQHLDGCPACRARLDELKKAASELSTMPAFERTLAALDTARPPARRGVEPVRRRWPALLAVAVPLAAALVFVVVSARHDEVRLKGAPTLELLRAERPVTSARPGETVTLAVGGAGSTHALVFAIDAEGTVSRLWPSGAAAAPIDPGARVRLSPSFEVTPGSLELVAFFTSAPQPAEPVMAELRRQLAAGRRASTLELPASFGRTARWTLEVTP